MLCQHVGRLLRRKKKVQMQRKKRQGTKQDIWECQVSKMPGWDETQLTRLVLLKTERRKHWNGCQGTYTNKGYEAGRTGMPIQGQEQKGKRELWFQFGFINKNAHLHAISERAAHQSLGFLQVTWLTSQSMGGFQVPMLIWAHLFCLIPDFFFF